MTFATILKAFKEKKNNTLKQKLDKEKKETNWTFKEKKQENIDIVNNPDKKEINKDWNTEVKKKEDSGNQEQHNDEKILKRKKRIKDNLRYLQMSLGDELEDITLETLLDEFKFLKFKKYELKNIKKNEEFIQKNKDIQKAITELENSLIQRIEKYNYFIEKLSKGRNDINLNVASRDSEDYAEKDLRKIEIDNENKIEDILKRKTKVLTVSKYKNIGETITKFLLENKNNYVEGKMGWNESLYDCAEDWAIKRAIGIVEEFRLSHPDVNLSELNHTYCVVLDITDKTDIKILSVQKQEINNLDHKLNTLEEYKSFFHGLLKNIFCDNMKHVLKEQVLDIENSTTKVQLSEEQILSFRELKYMIGEIIGEISNSRSENLKDYSERVVEEIYKKCVMNNFCTEKQKQVFYKIFGK